MIPSFHMTLSPTTEVYCSAVYSVVNSVLMSGAVCLVPKFAKTSFYEMKLTWW